MPKPNRSLQEQQFPEILSAVVEKVYKKFEDQEGKTGITCDQFFYMFSIII